MHVDEAPFTYIYCSPLQEVVEVVTYPPVQPSSYPDYASDYTHDYIDEVVAPTASEPEIIPGNDYVAVQGVGDVVKEAEPRLDIVDEDEDYEYNTVPPPLEYHEYKIAPESGPPRPTPLPALDPNTPYSYPEAPINYDYQQNDVLDDQLEEETDNSLDYAESQRVHGGWNDLQVRRLFILNLGTWMDGDIFNCHSLF